MPLPSPQDLAQAVPGVDSISCKDFSCAFYTMLQHPAFLRSQRFPRVRGSDFGRPDVPWLVPVMVVMAMGSWISALLCQIVHLAICRPIYRDVITFRRAPSQRAEVTANKR